ncbi:MAG TPA: hypothetical protein VLT84_07600 [Acidobacteriota bacterium]|nr:hypothetical protein [Acidobacteriota bacterium]
MNAIPALVVLAALSVPSAVIVAPPAFGAAPTALRSAGRPDLAIYSDGFAYVREPRRATLAKGENEVVLDGAPERVDSTSVRLDGPGLDVREQSFRYDLWSDEKVFRRMLGDSIYFRWQNRVAQGVLVGIQGDALFIRRGDSTDALLMVRRAQLQELEFPARRGPWSLAATPSLHWRVRTEQAGEKSATLAYLTGGLGWRTEYVATLSGGDRNLALSGWASISNNSGAAFTGAKVSLVAGELHRAGGEHDRGGSSVDAPSKPDAGAAGRASDLFAYHLYPVADPLDLPSWGTIQVPLVAAEKVAARRAHRYDGARDGSKVRAQVVFENEKGSGLGLPLPAGRVRVFAPDASGATTLVGEDAIGHTPAGATVRLTCGIAFDLTGERTRVAHTRIARNVTEDEFRIVIRNGGGAEATVTVAETLYGTWEITRKSGEFRAVDAERIEFDVKVPARGDATVAYTVRYTY